MSDQHTINHPQNHHKWTEFKPSPNGSGLPSWLYIYMYTYTYIYVCVYIYNMDRDRETYYLIISHWNPTKLSHSWMNPPKNIDHPGRSGVSRCAIHKPSLMLPMSFRSSIGFGVAHEPWGYRVFFSDLKYLQTYLLPLLYVSWVILSSTKCDKFISFKFR